MSLDHARRDEHIENTLDEEIARRSPSNAHAPGTCAFFSRGRCVAGDACAFAHHFGLSPTNAHAMNCGCPSCRRRRDDIRPHSRFDVGDTVERSSGDDEEGAVPRAVVERERVEREDAKRSKLELCARIHQPHRVAFWRAFLANVGRGKGNKLAPYWRRLPDVSSAKKRRANERDDDDGNAAATVPSLTSHVSMPIEFSEIVYEREG